MRTALKGALATLDHATGHPYASLILLATEPDGAPTFLISRLALHTRNLEKDSRASVLIDGTGGLGDPLTGGRLTLTGVARPSTSPTALRRFLARHPSAEGYAHFADFSMYELEIARGHYIGGFGRIVDLQPARLLTDIADAQALVDAEPDIVAHMNSDHADALALYATELAGQPAGRMANVRAGSRRRRFAALHKRRTHRLSTARAHSRRGAQDSCFAGAAGTGSANRLARSGGIENLPAGQETKLRLQHFDIAYP